MFVAIFPLICAMAFSGGEIDSWLSRIDTQAFTKPSTVHAREITGFREAASAESLRDRISEFVSSNPDRYSFADPQSGTRFDSLKQVHISRNGRGSLRTDTIFVHVYTSSGESRRKVVIWTDSERLVLASQLSELADRNNIVRATASEYSAQLDSGIMPWDLARVDDGGYIECVSIAISLLEQAADVVVTDLTDGSVRVESKALGVSIDIGLQGQINLVAFHAPGRNQILINKFYWDHDSPALFASHPLYWVSYRIDATAGLTEHPVPPSQSQRIIKFDKVKIFASDADLPVSFDWRDLCSRVRDKRSQVVYDHDGNVDAAATERASQAARMQPVRFFDVVETDHGPAVRTHVPSSGLSHRHALLAFGFALLVVGAVALLRRRTKP